MLYGIVAATEALSSVKVPIQDLADLAKLAQGGDQNTDDIKFWFQVHFPPTP